MSTLTSSSVTIDHEYVTKRLEKRLAVMELADEDLDRAQTLMLRKAEAALMKCNVLVQELQRWRRQIETFVDVSSLWSDAASALVTSQSGGGGARSASPPPFPGSPHLAMVGGAAALSARSPLMESAAMLRQQLLAPLEQLMGTHLPPVQRLHRAVVVQTTALAEVKDLRLTCALSERAAVTERMREVLAAMGVSAEDLLSATWRLDSIWSDVSHKLGHAALRTQAIQLRAAAQSLDAVAVSMGAPLLLPAATTASSSSSAPAAAPAMALLPSSAADASGSSALLLGFGSPSTPVTPMRRTPRLRAGDVGVGVPHAIRGWNGGSDDGAVTTTTPITPAATTLAPSRTPEPLSSPARNLNAPPSSPSLGAQRGTHEAALAAAVASATALSQLWITSLGARRRGSSSSAALLDFVRSTPEVGRDWSGSGSAAALESHSSRGLVLSQWRAISTGGRAGTGITSGVAVDSIAAMQQELSGGGGGAAAPCPSTFLLTFSGDLLVSFEGGGGSGVDDDEKNDAAGVNGAGPGSGPVDRALVCIHGMLLLRALSPFRRHIVAVAAGRAHVAVLTCSCEVWTWGDGRRGQLGHGNPSDASSSALGDGIALWLPPFFPPVPPSPAHERTPRLVTALLGKPVTRISCGDSHSIAATQGGAVFAWGANSHGQLGLGQRKRRNRFVPTRVEALHVAVTAVCAGATFSAVIATDQLWVWGVVGHGRILPLPRHIAMPSQRSVAVVSSCRSQLSILCSGGESMYAMGIRRFARSLLHPHTAGGSGGSGSPYGATASSRHGSSAQGSSPTSGSSPHSSSVGGSPNSTPHGSFEGKRSTDSGSFERTRERKRSTDDYAFDAAAEIVPVELPLPSSIRGGERIRRIACGSSPQMLGVAETTWGDVLQWKMRCTPTVPSPTVGSRRESQNPSASSSPAQTGFLLPTTSTSPAVDAGFLVPLASSQVRPRSATARSKTPSRMRKLSIALARLGTTKKSEILGREGGASGSLLPAAFPPAGVEIKVTRLNLESLGGGDETSMATTAIGGAVADTAGSGAGEANLDTITSGGGGGGRRIMQLASGGSFALVLCAPPNDVATTSTMMDGADQLRLAMATRASEFDPAASHPGHGPSISATSSGGAPLVGSELSAAWAWKWPSDADAEAVRLWERGRLAATTIWRSHVLPYWQELGIATWSSGGRATARIAPTGGAFSGAMGIEQLARECSTRGRLSLASVRSLWFLGIPPALRSIVWPRAVGNALKISPEIYELFGSRADTLKKRRASGTSNASGSFDALKRRQRGTGRGKESSLRKISVDLQRTFPPLCLFQRGCRLHDKLYRVLEAFACFRPELGYIQSMSYIGALVCLFVANDEYLCFQCVANVLMNLYPFYRMKTDGALRRYNELFDRMVKAMLPKLHAHLFSSLEDEGSEGGGSSSGSGGSSGGGGVAAHRGWDPNAIDAGEAEQLRHTLHTQLMSWMQTLFAKALPLDAATRVFDNFLLDGPVFLFRVAIALLGLLAPEMIGQPQERCVLVLTHRTQSVWTERVTEQSLFARVSTTNVPEELRDQLTEVLNDPLFFQKSAPGSGSGGLTTPSPSQRRSTFANSGGSGRRGERPSIFGVIGRAFGTTPTPTTRGGGSGGKTRGRKASALEGEHGMF